jgi:hypothetical protein
MPVPEPVTGRRFWEQVRDQSGWPAANEDLVRNLADEWSWASRLFATASDLPLPDLQGGWPDGTGESFAQSVGLLVDRSSRVEVSALQQRSDLLSYADILAKTKQAISEYVDRRYFTYEFLYGDQPQRNFIGNTAVEVNRLLDQGAEQAGRIRTAVAVEYQAGGGGYAEFDDINQFIYSELVNNPKSADGEHIRNLLELNTTGGTAAALVEWAAIVWPGADWDHKPDILAMTVGNNNTTPVPGVPGSIRHDFWSNLHFGYVGLDIGFDGETLRQGADAADLADRGDTDPADDVAVRIGIELREQYSPEELRPEHVEAAIKAHYQELVDAGGIVTGA